MDVCGELINQRVAGAGTACPFLPPFHSHHPVSGKMTLHIVLSLLSLLLFGPRISWSQLSLATCKGDGYVWVSAIGHHSSSTIDQTAIGVIPRQLYNSRSQSPCDIAAYLTAVCQGSSTIVLSAQDAILR